MLRSLAIYLLILILLAGVADAGQGIVAVQSVRVPPYDEAVKGFGSVCVSPVKSLVISELNGTEVIREINALQPVMVLAIGVGALKQLKVIQHIPVIYFMVLNPQSILPGTANNFTGVCMNMPQDIQLSTVLKFLPDTKKIGLF